MTKKLLFFPKMHIFICLAFVFEDFWLLTTVFPGLSISQRFCWGSHSNWGIVGKPLNFILLSWDLAYAWIWERSRTRDAEGLGEATKSLSPWPSQWHSHSTRSLSWPDTGRGSPRDEWAMRVALLGCLRAHQHITRTPQEPLSSLVWETLPPALLGALSGVGYMFGGSQTNEDFKMWHVRARSLATLGLFIQSCTHTAETLPDLCSFSPAQSAGLTNTQFPTLIHVHKLSTEVVMKSNHNDIFPW